MDFEHRGKPSYKVSSGVDPEFPELTEHWLKANSYKAALSTLASLSDFGRYNIGQRIVDSSGNEVFSLSNSEDQKLMEKALLDGEKIKVIQRSKRRY